MRTDLEFSVFLGDVNLHVPHEYSQRADLRARVLHHVVLAEPLIVADSHSLNSPMLRSLFVRRDEPPYACDDLGALFRSGDLRVSRRDVLGPDRTRVTSFRQIQADHAARGVVNGPPPEYAAWLDEMTEGRVVEYSADAVSASFKRGFTDRLDRQLAAAVPGTPTGYLRTLEMMRDWAAAREVVLYKDIRDTYQRWLADEKNATREAAEAADFVERSASGSYHLAVPQAIVTAVSGPRNDDLVELPTSIRPTGSMALPPGLINPTVWQHLPVDAVTEILDLASRQTMLAELARARTAGNARVDPVMGSIALFADEVEAILHGAFVPGVAAHDEALAAMRRARRKARVTAIRDESDGSTGVRMHADDLAPNFFDVLHIPVPVTESRSWIEQDDAGTTPNHRVVAGTDLTTAPASPSAA